SKPHAYIETGTQFAAAHTAAVPVEASPADLSAEMPATGPAGAGTASVAAAEPPAAERDTIPVAQVTAAPDGESTVGPPDSAMHGTGALPAAGADDESFTPGPRPSGPLHNWLVWSDEDAVQPPQPAGPEQPMMPREAEPAAYKYEPV